MNNTESEWKPAPTDPETLRRVRVAVKATASAADVARLRSFIVQEAKGIIPHEVRGGVWMHLLRVNSDEVYAETSDQFAKRAMESVRDDNSKEQILKDVTRTRPSLETFKQSHVRNALTKLLSLFCQRQGVSYIQGFNELLVPFLLLDDVGQNPRLVYALYSAFLKSFVPWVLDSAEHKVFEVLKRAFRYFGRLLLYFDPNLFWMLDSYFMTPDIYATSWLVTIFARNFTVEATYALWDLLLLEDNALSTYFFAVALILSKRDEILTCDESHLPEILMNMSATTVEEVHRLWKIGNELRVAQTPPSFQRLMASRLLRPLEKANASTLNAAKSLAGAVTVQTTLEDIMPGGPLHFFTWDCRPNEIVRCGKIAQAAVLPLDALRNADDLIKANRGNEVEQELDQAVEMNRTLSGSSHICLIGSGEPELDDLDVNPLALRLTQEGIPCVSTLRGGFKEVMSSMDNGNPDNVEFVDLDRKSMQEAIMRRTKKSSPSAKRKDAKEKYVSYLSEKSDAEVKEVLNSMLTSRQLVSRPIVLPSADANLFTTMSQVENASPAKGEKRPSEFNLLADLTIAPAIAPEPQKSPPVGAASAGSAASNSQSQSQLKDSKNLLDDLLNPFSESSAKDSSKVQKDPLEALFNPFADATVKDSPKKERSKNPFADVRERSVTRTVDKPKPEFSLEEAKAFWGKSAFAGWLDEKSMAYPPAGIRKGFTLNVENEGAMQGIQLFPCSADSTQPKKVPVVVYLGVSVRYILFLLPHRSSSHQMELSILRRMLDLKRISFRKHEPDCMTLEFAQNRSSDSESFSVRIMDGRQDAIALITKYKAATRS